MSETAQPEPESFDIDLEDSAATRRLEEQLFGASDWTTLVRLYRARIESEIIRGDPRATAELHFRRGQLLEERIGDADAAIQAYWTVAQLQPSHGGALRQLRRIHAQREDWSAVEQIIELEADAEMSDSQRASSLAEIGEMTRTALGDPEAASARFEQSLAIDEDQIDALAGLARTRESQDRPSDAAQLWERVVEQQRGPDRATALIALGVLLEGPLEETDRAAECFRRALTDDPRDARAVEALVQHAERREQWSLLADLSERRFDLAAGARKRAEIALAASRLHLEHFDNPPTARLWLERARELTPDDAQIDTLAADIERRAGNRPALRAALERSIGHESTPELAALLEAAELCCEADDDERALEHLRGAVLAAPTDAEVTAQLDHCLRRLCRDADRVDVLERRVVLADDDRMKAELLSEIAHLQEEVLEDPDAAQIVWQRCFELDPQHREALDELVARLTKAEDWDGLRSTLETACELGREEARAQALCTLGDVQMLRFGDPEAAARAYELALDLDSQATRALEGLAQIAEGSGDDTAIVRAYAREAEVTTDRRRLASLVWELVRVHDARDETDAALGWLERLRRVAPDDPACLEAIVVQHARRGDLEQADGWVAALEALHASATGEALTACCNQLLALQRRLGDKAAATRWAEASLEAEPGQLEITRELVELYRDERRHQDRAPVQRRLADLLAGDEQVACLVDLAALLEEQLGDLDDAVVVLWRVAAQPDCEPSHIEHLTQLLERAGRYEELAQHLLEQCQRLDGATPEARALELRRAELLIEPLGQFEQAADEYRRLHEADGECPKALAGLERALRAGHDTAGLARLLAERAAVSEDPDERRRLQFEGAALLEESGCPFDEIRDAYTALADQDEDLLLAADASSRLEQLLERGGEWGELRARLEATLERRDGDDKLALRERLAAVCRDRLADRAGACEHLEAAGALAPRRAQVWQALALLYDAEDRTDDLYRVLEAELGCDLEHAREVALRGRAGRLCAADDTERARDHYERIIELEPGHAEASEFLVDYYDEAGQHERLVDLLRARLNGSPVTPATDADARRAQAQQTSLRLRIAALQADSLGDLDAAIATLEPAHANAAAASVVAEPLADLLQRDGRSAALVELCREMRDGEADAGERARWQMRLADTLRASGRREEAVETYAAIDQTTPSIAAARAALQSLYREIDRPEPLAALLAQQLREPLTHGIADPADHDGVSLRLELAALYRDRLERPSEAFEQLRLLLALEPSRAEALAQALELADTQGRPDQLEKLLTLGLEQQRSGGERARLLLRRGKLLAGELERPEKAIEDLREALAIAADDVAARAALREVYQGLGRWPAALDCLYVEARQSAPPRRVELLELGVELAHTHLSVDATLPWLERLRAERPDDARAVARIAEVHRQAGRPEALLRTIEQQILISSDPCERRSLHADRARILERDLASPGRALAALDAANAAAPGEAPVLAELARLRGELGLVREQVAALEELIEAVEPSARRALHEQCSALCSRHLAEYERASRHLEAALDSTSADDPRRSQLLQELGEALRRDGRTSDWAHVAESELRARAPNEERAIELRESLAISYGDQLAAREMALAHWLELLEWAARADSDCPTERRDAIEREVLAALRQLRNPIELETRLAGWLERHPDDAEGWVELARLRDEVLHSNVGAVDAYRQALAAEPDRLDALLGLRTVAQRCGLFDKVADTLERELDLRCDASDLERTELLRSLGSVSWSRLADGPRAQRAFSRALEIDPDDLSALRSLQQLHESLVDHAAALDLYERECEVLGEREPERRMVAWLRVGELARRFTDEPARALAAYEAAAVLDQLPEAHEREWAELLLASQDPERHAEVFAAWCDRDDSPAAAHDHLLLADHLTELDRGEQALERTRSATRCEEGCREAWEALARRCRDVQGVVEEAEALERAAQLSLGREACGRYLAAALVIEPEDSRRALDWLEQAVEADPGDSNAQASLARVAECEEQFELAERAAQAALTSAAATEVDVDPTVRLEAALVGGRCASRRDDLDAAAISFQAALRIDPEHPEALAAAGEALYRSGDAPAARELLEQLLSLDADPNASGAHLVIIGEAHEIAGRDEDALARFEAAIEAETTLATAHAGRVRCLERCGRTADAIDALEGWAATSDDDERSAEALLHAARLELELDQRDAATAHLQQATGHDPTCTEAWCELAELLLADGDDVAALEAAERGAEQAGPDDLRARLDRVRGRAHEQAGSIEAATAAWAAVAASQPRDSQAALEHSRLLRSDGDWEGAAQALADFVARHPEPSVLELASIHLERGRLLAGPLEDVEAAVAEYERALVLDPTRSEARAKLAWLLAQVPGRRPEAVVAQGELLRLRPADPEALRALLRVASEDGSADAAAAGGSILRALGVASEAEGRLAACTARADLTSLAQPSRLEDPRDEQLRTAICELREAFEALPTTPPEASSRVDRTLAEIRAELAAPGLDGLGDDDLRAALIGAAALALDPLSPHAETEIAARLDAAVGRRALRRARTLLEPLTLESLSQIDAAAWRDELRGLAAAVALDRNECDLREALVSLIGHHRPEAQPGDWGDLCALVDASPSARALLTRVVSRWCERIERDIRGNR